MASPAFARQVHHAVGGGRPLSGHTRAFLEPQLGTGLGAVRVHEDAHAGGLVRQIDARAFTLGRDIFFAPGQLQARTRSGMHLLAHEVAHTLQAGPARGPGMGKILRSSTKVNFDSDNYDAAPIIYDEYGNVTRGKGLAQAYADGAEHHFGVRTETNSTFHTVSAYADDDNKQSIAKKRKEFIAAFNPPKKLDQDIVIKGKIKHLTDVDINASYAGAVFDAAVKLVTESSNVDVDTDTAMRDAGHSNFTGSGHRRQPQCHKELLH